MFHNDTATAAHHKVYHELLMYENGRQTSREPISTDRTFGYHIQAFGPAGRLAVLALHDGLILCGYILGIDRDVSTRDRARSSNKSAQQPSVVFFIWPGAAELASVSC